jgi:hypothetical protein
MARATKARGVVDVDLEQIMALEHLCDGCRSSSHSCCSSYDVCVKPSEMERIVGMMAEASRYCRRLKRGGGYDNVFEETEDGEYHIDTTDNGLCVFAYQAAGKISCGLHSAALSLGLPWHYAKPEVCLLWPLSLSTGSLRTLSVDSEAYSFHCNRHRSSQERYLSKSIRNAISAALGEPTAAVIEEAAKTGHSGCRVNYR